ncbi:MAG: GNAT family N-acetyltransferase [Caulobacterales bacterium]|nr:GNAT family N-acetyltransferase [Caulobacterales bacterium]
MAREPADIIIRWDRRAGDDALITRLHAQGYGREGARFAGPFPAYVAETVAEARLDAARDSRVWFAERGGRAIGCAAMIARGDRGQLRWVVLLEEARGLGLGRRLVERALAHARAEGWREVYLETTDGLGASMRLYETLGFKVVSDAPADLWHGRGRLIVMSLAL